MAAITLTEANPIYSAGYGGGPETATLTDINPEYFAEGGGGPALATLTDLPPIVLPPIVTTDPATGIGPIQATLNGILDDDGGFPCDCGFEWGLDTTYGHFTSTKSKATGQTFSEVIGGLVPGTTYHFRAIATNIFGPAYGVDRTVTTKLVISRAYALAREEL